MATPPEQENSSTLKRDDFSNWEEVQYVRDAGLPVAEILSIPTPDSTLHADLTKTAGKGISWSE
jgi:hypothetical protein